MAQSACNKLKAAICQMILDLNAFILFSFENGSFLHSFSLNIYPSESSSGIKRIQVPSIPRHTFQYHNTAGLSSVFFCLVLIISYFIIITRSFWRCPWCNSYRRRKWTRFQILDETDCILHSTNAPGKGMNPIILPPAMGK